jgi:hypothetical protein
MGSKRQDVEWVKVRPNEIGSHMQGRIFKLNKVAKHQKICPPPFKDCHHPCPPISGEIPPEPSFDNKKRPMD